ncbi:MAG: protein kinase [bacterium]|nr:protein kinase [bacterium]
MPVILVVEQDATHAEQINAALQPEGWTVRIFKSRDAAARSAAAQPPDLVMASSAMPGIRDFLAGFSRRKGGPGSVVLIPMTLLNRVTAAEYQADAITPKPISTRDLRLLAGSFLESPDTAPGREASPQPRPPQLSSAEIFGEVLAAVEAEAHPKRPGTPPPDSAPRPSDDVERKLEETLSGVLPIGNKLKRPATAERPKRRGTRHLSPSGGTGADEEIDKLLDKTLSTLELPRTKKPSRPEAPPPAGRPAIPSPPPQAKPLPAIPPPAVTPPAAASGRTAEWAGFEPPPELETPVFQLDAAPLDTMPAPLADLPPPKPQPGQTPPEETLPEVEPLPEEPALEAPEAGALVVEEAEFELAEEPEIEEPLLEAASLPVEPLSDAEPPAAQTPATASPAAVEALFEDSAAFGADSSGEARFARSSEIAPRFDPQDFLTRELPIIKPDDLEGQPFGDYSLLERIAVGGMAEVWKARRRGVEGFQKTVAIKKILSHLTGNPDFITMFIDEAKLAAQLNHNNIIQIYDLGKVGSDFFIAMEYVDGRDLRSILATGRRLGRRLPIGLALMIAGYLARALDYAHRKRDFDNRALGLVHRDVSPQNVLISHEGEIKLCDFGIVKAVVKASTTQMGALKGKLQYMSPEQAWGKSVDARSDIFSLGSVVFELLTGTKLFSGDSEIGVLDAVRECRVRSPGEIVSAISPEVDRIVRKALTATPEARYQTAGELEQDLNTVLFELDPTPSQSELASYMHQLFGAPSSADVEAAPERIEVESVESAGPDELVSASPAAPTTGKGPVPVIEDARADAAEAAGPKVAEASPLEPSATGSKRRRLLIAAVVTVVVVAAIVGAFLIWPWLSSRDTAPQAETPPPEASPATTEVTEPAAEDAGAAEAAEAGAGETAIEGSPAAAPEAEEGAASRSPTELTPAELQEMVDQQLGRVAEEMTQDFEVERRRLERELAATQRAAEALEAEGSGEEGSESEADGETDGSDEDPDGGSGTGNPASRSPASG